MRKIHPTQHKKQATPDRGYLRRRHALRTERLSTRKIFMAMGNGRKKHAESSIQPGRRQTLVSQLFRVYNGKHYIFNDFTPGSTSLAIPTPSWPNTISAPR
jgi:hypothetical protein